MRPLRWPLKRILKMMLSTRHIAIILAITCLVGGLAIIRPVVAQTAPSVIITWQAQNYFPADFPGKARITPSSQVTAAIDMVQGVKLINLSSAQVSWFVNDALVQSGLGLTNITFTASPDANNLVSIRVQIQTGGGTYQNSISIQAVAPFSVIDHPSVTPNVSAGSSVTLTAWPYFFNVGSLSDLKFTWQVNGGTYTSNGNQLTLQIGTPQSVLQQTLPVTLTTQNTQNPLEFSRNISVLNIAQ